jgi:integrase
MRTKQLLAKGVYKDRSGIAIRVSVGGVPREFRKDEHGKSYAHKSTDWLKIERKRIDAREHLKEEREIIAATSLRADARSYLKALTGRTKADAENLLAHWLSVFGDRARDTITPLELRQHAATWTCQASTFNHRRQAMISLYTALNGPRGYNPAREMPKQQEIAGAPKALPYTVINAVLKAMPDTQSRARLKVMAYTGLPQMQIEKLTPDDWHGARLRVTPRRKGAGAAGRWIPLSPDAQAALADFARLKCWGPFSRSSLWKAWKAYGPKGSNPYSLRHSWITELYRRSNGDVLALQQLAIHSRLEQTQRYAAAALEDRMSALVLPRILTTNGKGKPSKTLANAPLTRDQQKGGRRRPNVPKLVKKAKK